MQYPHGDTDKNLRWRWIEKTYVPSNLRWDCPPEEQGQIVFREYAHHPTTTHPATEQSSMFKRVVDSSLPISHASRAIYYMRNQERPSRTWKVRLTGGDIERQGGEGGRVWVYPKAVTKEAAAAIADAMPAARAATTIEVFEPHDTRTPVLVRSTS